MADAPLVSYMTTTSRHERAASYLDTYAARILDGTDISWEIPNTRASVLKDIAALLRQWPSAGEAAAVRLSPDAENTKLDSLRRELWEQAQELERLREYVQHTDDCDLEQRDRSLWPETKCTCGLAALTPVIPEDRQTTDEEK